MKAVFIIYNHAITEEVLEALESNNIRGYTRWRDIQGQGTATGEPHLGTHTWPSLNDGILTVTDDEKSSLLLSSLRKINDSMPEQGLRAFMWQAEVGV